jgi:hypothetical protein
MRDGDQGPNELRPRYGVPGLVNREWAYESAWLHE